MKNPHIIDSTIRLRIVLPCSKEIVWNLIATPEGLASWFPQSCKGTVAKGKTIEFGWADNSIDTYKILDLVNGRFMEMELVNGAKVRYSIDRENPVVVTIEATYPQTIEGKQQQLIDVAPWAFYLTNLKSVTSGAIDLRNNNPKLSWRDAFLD